LGNGRGKVGGGRGKIQGKKKAPARTAEAFHPDRLMALGFDLYSPFGLNECVTGTNILSNKAEKRDLRNRISNEQGYLN
jgi:hypothetical protein